MKFIIFWDAYPEKLSEILRLLKIHDKIWIPPEGLKIITEYVTANGKFLQIVEATTEAAIYKYIYVLGLKSEFCKNVEVSPIMYLENWIETL